MTEIQPLLLPASNRTGRGAFNPQNRPASDMCATLLALTPEMTQTMREMGQKAQQLNPRQGQGGLSWFGQNFYRENLMYWIELPDDHQEVTLRAGTPVKQEKGQWVEYDPPTFSLRLAQAEHEGQAQLIEPHVMQELQEKGLLQSSPWNLVSIEANVKNKQIHHFELSDKEVNLGPLGWTTFLKAELTLKQGPEALKTWKELFEARPKIAISWLREHSGQLQNRFGTDALATLLGHDHQKVRQLIIRESQNVSNGATGRSRT